MKVGDLVALRLCQQAGKIGMIMGIPEPSHLAKRKPELALYMVLLDTGNQCYTGNQLIRHRWMENESR
jgi:hypothetical protein